MAAFILLGFCWTACGVLDLGWCYAYWRRRNGTNYFTFYDRIQSKIGRYAGTGLITIATVWAGPIALVITLLAYGRTGFTSGWGPWVKE